MIEQEIIKLLQEKFGESIIDAPFPKAFCPGEFRQVKAIYLGCDPTNKHSRQLPYAFAHQSEIKAFNRFIHDHTEQLRQVGLTWETVYTQNLCQNHFKKETSENLSLWKKVSKEYWIEKLKEELEIFPSIIPVLLSSQYLLEVLGTKDYEKILAPAFYTCQLDPGVPPDYNKLSRILIPFYRGKSRLFNCSYHLRNIEWQNYKYSVTDILHNQTQVK